MTAKVIRCDRCRRRMRDMTGWNVNMIAGLVVGHLCPECQAPQEDLEAELNLITGRSDFVDMGSLPPAVLPPGLPPGLPPECHLAKVIVGLIRTYPTPEIMRDKATQLTQARRDQTGTTVSQLMQALADDMESGALWET
jgi:hypothetical protein